jgi:CubicO group peptidase (beta-lactamase class C family)
MLVMQNGRTLFEHYANGGAADRRWPIFSGTKSFWGIAALCAVKEGLLRFDDHVADTITEWKNDPLRSKITVRELLHFTDGIEAASHLQSSSIRDRDRMAIRLRLVARPGSAFIYGPSHLQIFLELLRRKLHGRTTTSYLEKHVLNPLGLYDLNYKEDSRGHPLAATGFELTAREWARFGEMILGRGTYNGHRVVPANLLSKAFVGSPANPSYGLTFWLNRGSSVFAREVNIEKMLDLPWERASWKNICICRSAPSDMVVALGSDYQRLYIIPSMNALIVRQGSNARFSDAHFLTLLFGRHR